MAEARNALAETVCVTAFSKAPSSVPSGIKHRFGWSFICSDVIAIVLGLAVAVPIASLFSAGIGPTELPDASLLFERFFRLPTAMVHIALAILAAACFSLMGHYGKRRLRWDACTDVVITVWLLAAVHFAVRQFILPEVGIASLVLGWVLAAGFLLAARRGLRTILIGSRIWFEPAVVIGQRERAVSLATAVADHDDLGLEVTHVIQAGAPSSGDGAPPRIDGSRATLVGSDDILSELIFKFRRETLLFCPAPEDYEATGRLLQTVGAVDNKIGIVFPFPELIPKGGHDLTLLSDGTALVWVSNRLGQPGWRAAKRAADIVGSLALLVFFAPIFAVLAAPALYRNEPVFFGHRRVGRHGRPFTCYKFRTMITNAAEVLETLLATDERAREEWDATHKLKHDPRVTSIGAVMRRTSLDELPQLWNVLKGDMSLVGPRPIVEGELKFYGDDILSYFSVKPGITGLWQVSGRSDTCYDQRVAFDRCYVRNWSPRNDVIILLKTARVVLTRAGAY